MLMSIGNHPGDGLFEIMEMKMDDLEIPMFLRIPQEVRNASWRGRKLTRPKASVKITRNEDPQTRAFRKMIEKQAAEKKAARFKMLRERAKVGR